jgi:hypothetical protein
MVEVVEKDRREAPTRDARCYHAKQNGSD